MCERMCSFLWSSLMLITFVLCSLCSVFCEFLVWFMDADAQDQHKILVQSLLCICNVYIIYMYYIVMQIDATGSISSSSSRSRRKVVRRETGTGEMPQSAPPGATPRPPCRKFPYPANADAGDDEATPWRRVWPVQRRRGRPWKRRLPALQPIVRPTFLYTYITLFPFFA